MNQVRAAAPHIAQGLSLLNRDPLKSLVEAEALRPLLKALDQRLQLGVKSGEMSIKGHQPLLVADIERATIAPIVATDSIDLSICSS